VTAELIRAGAARHADEGTLREGRKLFVSRCIECHTLPVVSDYRASAWPHLVDKMADRADLKSTERNAVVAYILAARAQTK
jgi:mono/diheme cytochrome c family protein